MSATTNAGKSAAKPSDIKMASWKKKFFASLAATPTVKAVFLRIETHHVQKNQVEHQLIPATGWKTMLPTFAGESAEQVITLRREIAATLRVNGVKVIHRDAEWMKYLKTHHEVGMSYAKLCGAI